MEWNSWELWRAISPIHFGSCLYSFLVLNLTREYDFQHTIRQPLQNHDECPCIHRQQRLWQYGELLLFYWWCCLSFLDFIQRVKLNGCDQSWPGFCWKLLCCVKEFFFFLWQHLFTFWYNLELKRCLRHTKFCSHHSTRKSFNLQFVCW